MQVVVRLFLVVMIGSSTACNFQSDEIRGTFAASFGSLDGWTFQSMVSGASTSFSSPVIQGSASARLDGYTAKVFSDSSCTTILGSATVSGGEFQISNLNLASSYALPAEISLYGRIDSSTGRTSDCTDLSLSINYYPDNQLVVRASAFELSNDKTMAYAISDDQNQLFKVELSTGYRSLVSGGDIGSGTNFDSPIALAISSDEKYAYIADAT